MIVRNPSSLMMIMIVKYDTHTGTYIPLKTFPPQKDYPAVSLVCKYQNFKKF